MWTAQSAVAGEERAHRSGGDGEFIQLAADRRQQRREDDGFTVWGPSGSEKTVDGDVRAHRGQEFFARAVRTGEQQFESALVWNSADVGELFAVRREADAGVYIAHELLRIATEHRHFVERAEKLIFLGGFGEINVIAVGRKGEAVENADSGREYLHVAAGGHLADHQTLHFAVAQDVHDVLTVRRNRHAGRFAGFREFQDAHVLRVEGALVAARFEGEESDGCGGDERDYGYCGD